MPRGRLRKVSDDDRLQMAIDWYNYYYDVDSREFRPGRIPCTTGLALDLGYIDRPAMYQAIREQKLPASLLSQIKNCLSLTMYWHEYNLSDSHQVAGHIFGLKNQGWTDEQQISHSGIPAVPPQITINVVDKQ